ncbi:universal stress protein [Fictibacillus sp. FJAT-27399]|uniref:universal stress protein n=1 Tax=Fictibacillus sp. FJAT-27399 TaxID=1729689 RepID=UPI00078501E2|nr:universal stress protein [Fictibacillus sp. FJAT-27399]
MKYGKILVAMDESEGSKQALEYGIELANSMGSELTLAHVLNEPAYPLYGEGYSMAAYQDSIEQEVRQAATLEKSHGEELLAQASDAVPKDFINVKTELLEGEAARSICAYASTNNIDLIIMGSRGLSGLKRLVLGSVSQRVLSEANCPVLVTK